MTRDSSNRLRFVVGIVIVTVFLSWGALAPGVGHADLPVWDTGNGSSDYLHWETVFQEDFGSAWNASRVSDQLNEAEWDHICGDEGCYLKVECNCWISVPKGELWSDYAFTARIRLDRAGVTISFRSNEDGRYFVWVQQGRVSLGKEYPWGNRVILATRAYTIRLNRWYDVSVIGQGPDLSVVVDGNQQIQYTDESSPLYVGGVGFETCGDGEMGILLIDSIKIQVSGSLVSGGVQNPQDLLDMAHSYLRSGEIERAEEAFARAIALLSSSQIGDGEAQALRTAGTSLAQHGRAALAMTYFSRALAYYDSTADLRGQAYCLLRLGECLLIQGDDDAAEGQLLQAHQLFLDLQDRVGQMEALEQLGSLYEGQEDWERAVEAFSEVLEIAEDLDDRGRQASILLKVGNGLIYLQRFREAESTLRQCQAAYRRLSDLGGEMAAFEALVRCYRESGQLDRAIAVQREAIERAVHEDQRLLQASLLLDLGGMYLWKAPSHEALDAIETGLAIFEREDYLEGVARGYGLLGSYYFSLHLHSVAQRYMETALEIYRSLGMREEEALCLGGLGTLLHALGDIRGAADAFDEACSIHQSISWDSMATGSCKLTLGKILVDRDDQAIDPHDIVFAYGAGTEALEIFRRHGALHLVVNALELLAICEMERNNRTAARSHIEEMIAISYDLGTIDRVRGAEGWLAGICWELRDFVSAKQYFESSLVHAESILQGLRHEPQIRSYLQRISHTYEQYIEFGLQTARVSLLGSLQLAERIRSRTLLDVVAGEDVGGYAEDGMRARIIEAEVIDQAVNDMVKALPSRTAVVEYLVLEYNTYVWVVRDGKVQYPLSIPMSRDALQDLVIRLRELIEQADGGWHALPSEELLSLSSKLYQALIGPLEKKLGEVDHLIIVPSGPLYYLPFAALLDCPSCTGRDYLGGQYLFEKYSLSTTPSLAALKYACQPREVAGSGLLALADPDSGNPLMTRLPEAEQEARAVRDILGYGTVYVGRDATELVLREQAAGKAHLLISSHGIFNPSNPLSSYLQLAPAGDTDGKLHTYEVFELSLVADLVVLSGCETLLPSLGQAREDARAAGGLSAGEEVGLDADLLNQITSGDEIVGLTRAFIYAGSSSVLSTLWSVASGPTRDLMIQFYKYLESGLPRAVSLQLAQADVKALYRHPRYWAAFVLVGDWR